MSSMKSETAVSRLFYSVIEAKKIHRVCKLTWTTEELQSTPVEFQNITVHQLKNFSHMSMPLEELAVF